MQLSLRREGAEDALKEYRAEVEQAEREIERVREEGAVLEKQFVKDVVNPINTEDKELGELVLKAYRKRSEMHDLADHGLQAEDMERAHEHVQAALEHDETVETHQAQLGAMQEELKRLEDASQQIDQSIDTAEGELEALETRMDKATSNLDITLSVKQGQVEVEQAAVVTDYSDAVVVEKEAIERLNGAIETRGNTKIKVLHEIKDFRKGIHELQWENQRLDLEDEDMLQRTKDLQLLRVTKSLQGIIKGGSALVSARPSLSCSLLL